MSVKSANVFLRSTRGGRRQMFALLGCALLLVTSLCYFRTVTAKPSSEVHLVRLSAVSEAGMVRIEIIADGSLADVAVETSSRNNETTIRVRGARSMLRASYETNDQLVRALKTSTGEAGGESFVQITVVTANGATVAQRQNFNRLVIGVAPDFASLRRARENREAQTASVAARNKSDASLNTSPSATATQNQTVAANVADAPTAQLVNAPLNDVSDAGGITRAFILPSSFVRNALPLRFGASPYISMLQNPSNAGSGSVAPLFTNLNWLYAPGRGAGVFMPGSTVAMEDTIGGRILGPGMLRPLIAAGASYENPLFYRSTDGRGTGIFTIAPRIEYEIPGVARGLRASYDLRLHRLSNGNWAFGQTFDFDSRFTAADYWRVGFRNHLVRASLDTEEFDPARETYIVGETFTRNDAGVRVEFLASDRDRIGFNGGFDIVRFDRSQLRLPVFLDYGELSGGLFYERDVSEDTTAQISFDYGNTTASVPLRPEFDAQNNRRRFNVQLGARTNLTETTGLELQVGYERSDYRRAVSDNRFRSLVFDATFRRPITDNTNFQLSALRKTQLSAFNLEGGNARLVSTGVAAQVLHQQTEDLQFGLAVDYQRLGFPVTIAPDATASGGVFVGDFAGLRRKDDLFGFTFESGYTFSELFRARFVYNFSRRASNVSPLTFNRNRLSLVFELGRRNPVSGRTF